MASNYTSNYNLCQWAASDKVLRTEFDADNAKIDAALAGKADQTGVSSLQTALNQKAGQSALDSLKTTVDGKADKTALASLQTALNKKADKTALNALQTTVTSQGTDLPLRNCRFIIGTYNGTGKVGSANPNTLTFPYKPVFLHVSNSTEVGYFTAVRGAEAVNVAKGGGSFGRIIPTWDSRSVSWYCTTTSAGDQANDSRGVYYYFAILEVK